MISYKQVSEAPVLLESGTGGQTRKRKANDSPPGNATSKRSRSFLPHWRKLFEWIEEVEDSTSMGVLAAIDKVLNDRMSVCVETQITILYMCGDTDNYTI